MPARTSHLLGAALVVGVVAPARRPREVQRGRAPAPDVADAGQQGRHHPPLGRTALGRVAKPGGDQRALQLALLGASHGRAVQERRTVPRRAEALASHRVHHRTRQRRPPRPRRPRSRTTAGCRRGSSWCRRAGPRPSAGRPARLDPCSPPSSPRIVSPGRARTMRSRMSRSAARSASLTGSVGEDLERSASRGRAKRSSSSAPAASAVSAPARRGRRRPRRRWAGATPPTAARPRAGRESESSVASSWGRPTSWTPIGSSEAVSPAGTDAAGLPMTFQAMQ